MIIPDHQIETPEVRSWKGLHLLHFQSSSCSQKVRVLLREKGLDWTSHPVNLAREEHVTPWFMGINPRGVVPVLVHDGVVHAESNDILEYLDALPSDQASFFPQDEEERRTVKQDLLLEDSLHMDLRNLTMGFIMPYRLARKSKATLARWENEGQTNPKRAIEVQWWRDYASDGIPPATAQRSVDAHRAVFLRLDERLEDSPWLIGDRLSVLDISWFITATRLAHAGYPLENHPHLADWRSRLAARPAFVEETSDPRPMQVALNAYQAFRRFTKTALRDVTDL